jgi:hypothetical protein
MKINCYFNSELITLRSYAVKKKMGNLFVADPTCSDKKEVCPFIPLGAGSQSVTLLHRFTESNKMNVTDVKCHL